jgi:hypothetical protein
MGIYTSQWKEYRRRHRRAVLGLFLGLPAAFVISFPFVRLSPQVPEIPMIVAVVLWGFIWAPLAFHVARFPCPRCGVQLHSGNGCDYCKLMLYEEA